MASFVFPTVIIDLLMVCQIFTHRKELISNRECVWRGKKGEGGQTYLGKYEGTYKVRVYRVSEDFVFV